MKEGSIEGMRKLIATVQSRAEADVLFCEWFSLVKIPQEKLQYCEDRLQYLEADRAGMDESTFLIHGSQVKSEIA